MRRILNDALQLTLEKPSIARSSTDSALRRLAAHGELAAAHLDPVPSRAPNNPNTNGKASHWPPCSASQELREGSSGRRNPGTLCWTSAGPPFSELSPQLQTTFGFGKILL